MDGGCKNFIEGRRGTREICTVPSERYFHGAARFNDSTMVIYGGFSNRCEEYCDDVWSFDLRYGRYIWTEIYPLDHFSRGEGPGRRWKFSVVTDGLSMAVFGGMTLWEGLLPENLAADAEASERGAAAAGDDDAAGEDAPSVKGYAGGFLDDFWVFRKRPLTRGWGGMDNFMEDVQENNDFAFGGGSDPENYAAYWEENPVDSGDFGEWQQVNRSRECLADADQGARCCLLPRMPLPAS